MGSNPTLSAVTPEIVLHCPRPFPLCQRTANFLPMLRLRRWAGFRYLSLLLLLGSPGLGGVGLQVVHTCSERMPWLAEAGPSVDAHHGGHSTDAPADQTCHCIGHCQATAAPATPDADVLPHAELAPRGQSRLSGSSAVAPSRRESHLLPPATAPPLI